MTICRQTGAGVLALMVLSSAVGACGGDATVHRVATPLTVLAAASLTEAFHDAEPGLEQKHPGLSTRYSFAGSQLLVTNLMAGAPADVVATADEASMKRLSDAGLVDAPRAFARNTLEIAVPKGNPKGIGRLADLARPDLIVVLADSAAPAGRSAREVLRKAALTVIPRSSEPDVKAALHRVEDGDADAAMVYVTDVTSARGRVTGVAIPVIDNIVTSYPIATVRAGTRREAAAIYVDEAVSGVVQDALRRRGFQAP